MTAFSGDSPVALAMAKMRCPTLPSKGAGKDGTDFTTRLAGGLIAL